MPLFITEYQFLARDGNNYLAAAGAEPAINEQAGITISGTSAPSAAFNALTRFIMVHAQEATCLKFGAVGATPVAVNTAHRLAAGETRFYGVTPGMKVAGVAGV